MSDHRARVDELLAEYRRSREHLATVHHQLAAVSASVSSKDGSVTATVSSRGTLTSLTIDDEAYRRYRPSELAAEIVRITAAATRSALTEAGEVLAPALPPGTDPQAVLFGTGDLAPAEVRPEPVEQPARAIGAGEAGDAGDADDDDEDFAAQSWLAEGRRGQR